MNFAGNNIYLSFQADDSHDGNRSGISSRSAFLSKLQYCSNLSIMDQLHMSMGY